MKQFFLFGAALLSGVGVLSHPIERSVVLLLSKQVAQSEIRVIGHNMEIQPSVDIQRLGIPGLVLQETKIIGQLELNGRVIEFSKATSVGLCQLEFNQQSVAFAVEHFPIDQGLPELISCVVDVSHNRIGEPHCQAVPLNINIDAECNGELLDTAR